MTTPFDLLAGRYDKLWSATLEGMLQRRQVWRELDSIFTGRDHVLDLGCGTGDDAVHLQTLGVQVTGIDNSCEMIRIAQARGVDARHLAIEDLPLHSGCYDGVLSNFGALNCVGDLGPVARELHRLIRPGGVAALCFLSRVYWPETARFALRLQFASAVRRWRGRAEWRGMTVWYPSDRAIARTFAPWFRVIQRTPIGGGDHVLHILRHAA